jgi:hypothetical protein
MKKYMFVYILLLCTVVIFSCESDINNSSEEHNSTDKSNIELAQTGEDKITLEFVKEYIEKDLSRSDVVKLIGEPVKDIGSGSYVYLYPMDDGNTLMLCFISEFLNTVFIQYPDGTQEPLFDEE